MYTWLHTLKSGILIKFLMSVHVKNVLKGTNKCACRIITGKYIFVRFYKCGIFVMKNIVLYALLKCFHNFCVISVMSHYHGS